MLTDDMNNELINSINEKKEAILKERCESLGLPIPNLKTREQRFNPFLLEQHKGFGELYYYNDGTKNGLFIVGFTDLIPPEHFMSTKIDIKFEVINEEPEWNKK